MSGVKEPLGLGDKRRGRDQTRMEKMKGQAVNMTMDRRKEGY